MPPLRNTTQAFGAVAQLLHWSIAIGILLQFVWTWRIDEADSIRQQYALIVQHKSIGMTVLALVLLRIGWRLFNRPPPLPAGMSNFQRRAAAVTHWALYALILLMPLSGWAWSSAAGYGAEFFGLIDIPDIVAADECLADWLGAVHEFLGRVIFFGLIDIPDIVAADECLADWLEAVHKFLGRAILALVGLHVLAAVYHHFVRRDELLLRMIPRWK